MHSLSTLQNQNVRYQKQTSRHVRGHSSARFARPLSARSGHQSAIESELAAAQDAISQKSRKPPNQHPVVVQPSPYGRMKNARDAAAITAVAAQPQIAIDRDSVSRPMTLGLRTISIITAISGAASTPFTTAAQ